MTSATLLIEPLGPQHDRAGFSCGEHVVDRALLGEADEVGPLNISRYYVARRPPSTAILGFYAISAHKLWAYDVADDHGKLITDYTLDGLPAVHICWFGVRVDAQRAGIGGDMMADALRRVKRTNAEGPAIFAVTVDPLDARAQSFYAGLGFQKLKPEARPQQRMFFPVAKIP